jgi:hypothetical protein
MHLFLANFVLKTNKGKVGKEAEVEEGELMMSHKQQCQDANATEEMRSNLEERRNQRQALGAMRHNSSIQARMALQAMKKHAVEGVYEEETPNLQAKVTAATPAVTSGLSGFGMRREKSALGVSHLSGALDDQTSLEDFKQTIEQRKKELKELSSMRRSRSIQARMEIENLSQGSSSKLKPQASESIRKIGSNEDKKCSFTLIRPPRCEELSRSKIPDEVNGDDVDDAFTRMGERRERRKHLSNMRRVNSKNAQMTLEAVQQNTKAPSTSNFSAANATGSVGMARRVQSSFTLSSTSRAGAGATLAANSRANATYDFLDSIEERRSERQALSTMRRNDSMQAKMNLAELTGAASETPAALPGKGGAEMRRTQTSLTPFSTAQAEAKYPADLQKYIEQRKAELKQQSNMRRTRSIEAKMHVAQLAQGEYNKEF